MTKWNLIGEQKHIYAMYSLGDFIGGFQEEQNQYSALVDIDFTKKITKNKKGEIQKTKTEMKINEPVIFYTEVDKKYKRNVYSLDNLIKEYDSGDSDITVKEYTSFKETQKRIIENYK